MGVIKDGSISGVLPTNKVFAINYPGYPSSIERALETLGGTQDIAKARESQSNKLELHFRPEDPYSHPLNGDIVMPCNQFLLKISKQKDEGRVSEGAEENICADIVGHVSETYNFNGMADYQHVLAVHADVARKKKRNWADVEPQFEKHGLIDADQEDLMILLPPLFSLKNTQENLVLQPSIYASQKKKQEGIVQHRWEMDIEPCLAIDFNIKDVPKKVNWEKFIAEGTKEWKYQMAVCDLFNERPIWIRQSLSEHLSNKGLSLGENSIKRFLFRAAYYFLNGPYRRFWIRKGYDPRKDPESRIYQRMDFRVPPPLRSYCDSGIASGLKHKWDDLCGFRVFPYKCQTSFQLFELVDDYIQQEIKKPLTQTSCTLATGWFSQHILEILRLRVKVRFLSVYPNPGAESFLKSSSLHLEKLKRTINVIKEKIVNKDEVHVEENEMRNDEDDDMEDDIEDENADEDFDAYEGLDMGGDGNDALPDSSYINQENVSKTYLQELFGSFPNNGQDAENSDEEYHIFDGSNSEDEDEDDY
ncbi:putative transcription factor IIIC subunit 5, HTH domain-containing protein [Helianthus debilis subsp. tardiflorus]